MQIKKQQLEADMEQWTGSKLGKEYVKAVYCHLAYLTYTQSVCMLSLFSRVRLFATPWAITLQLLSPWDSPGKNTGVGYTSCEILH